MDVWQVSQGEDASYTVTLTDSLGNVVTSYTGLEPLTATVWPGDDQSPVSGVATAVWLSPAAGTITVAIVGNTTGSMLVGKYRLKVTLLDGSSVRDCCEVGLEIQASPGAAATLPVYCSYQDMLRYASWLGQMQDLQSDLAGFLEQRSNARTWLEQIIQSHYQQQGSAGVLTFGWPVPVWGPARTGSNDKLLQDYLDAGKLMTAAPRRVVEITAKYAIGLVLQDQLTANDAKTSFYQSKAEWFLSEANDLVKCYSAEIDVNGDGYADITINCGATDCLYG